MPQTKQDVLEQFVVNFKQEAATLGFDVACQISANDMTFHADLTPLGISAYLAKKRYESIRAAMKEAATLAQLTLTMRASEKANPARMSVIVDFDEDLKNLQEIDIIEEYLKHFKNRLQDILKRQPKRKKDELPFPDKPASHADNRRGYIKRSTVKFGTQISPDVDTMVNEFREKTGLTKREIVEQALLQYMESNIK